MPPFIDKEGKTSDPFMAVLPAGAENIHHPQTREFIGRQWRMFIRTFTLLTEAERAERLRILIKNWETAYLAKYETERMTGVMWAICDLAARSALTAWLARQPTPTSAEVGNFYVKLLRYSTDLMSGHTGPVYQHPGAGVVTPHLAFTAARVSGLHPEDTVRVDEAGDGLIATFIGDRPQHVQYVDEYSLRRAIFNQLLPQLEIENPPTLAPVDVLFTSNTGAIRPSILLISVHPGGRLVIYGDRDWHHISAEVIRKLKMFRSVEAYATSLPPTLDESTRALHLQLFTQWKKLNKQIQGTLQFNGQLSKYQSESGVVIAVDNIEGTDTHYETFNLANPQARAFTDYISSFDAVRNTRSGTSREVVEHHRRLLEQEEIHKVAKARRDASINEGEAGTVAGDTRTQTAPDPAATQEKGKSQNSASQIQQICAERGITTLIHFTRIENLQSILQQGLLGRSHLETRGQDFLFNDADRADWHPEANCLSISFPNYQMFWRIRRETKEIKKVKDSQWIVLLLDAKVLWELDCAFCQDNAARKVVSRTSLEDRKRPDTLEAMFGDFYNIRHQDLLIPKNYPTHPQAEVLVFDPIPVRYIKAIYFWDADARDSWLPYNINANYEIFCTNRPYFKYRSDYETWRSENFDNKGIPLSYTAENNVDDLPVSILIDGDDDIPF